jgi:hypothetical protein
MHLIKLNTMKTYGRVELMLHMFFTLMLIVGLGLLHQEKEVPHHNPLDREGTERTLEPACTLWWREKSLLLVAVEP